MIFIQELYEKFIPGVIEFILEGIDGTQQENPLKLVIHQTNLNMLTQFCHLYEAMFVPNVSGEPFDNEEIECGFIEV